MTTFNDREKSFENKFAHDEALQFEATARRNRLLGLWAASLLGKTGAEADAYALDVVRADFIEVGHEDVYRKLAVDLHALQLDVALVLHLDEEADRTLRA